MERNSSAMICLASKKCRSSGRCIGWCGTRGRSTASTGVNFLGCGCMVSWPADAVLVDADAVDDDKRDCNARTRRVAANELRRKRGVVGSLTGTWSSFSVAPPRRGVACRAALARSLQRQCDNCCASTSWLCSPEGQARPRQRTCPPRSSPRGQ